MQDTCALLSYVAFLDVYYFSTLSHRWHNVQKKVIEHKVCVLIHPVSVRLIHVDGGMDT